MTTNTPLELLSTEQVLQQAVALHHAGQLEEAGQRYLSILRSYPNHPEANHNMGILAVQANQAAAGLPYLVTALEANPAQGQYWLSYIDALIQASQLEEARGVLTLAQQHGLEGREVEALVKRLEGETQIVEPSTARYPDTSELSQQVLSPAKQSSKKKFKTKPTKLHKSTTQPSPQEIKVLVDLFNQGCFTETAILAQTMTVHFPLHNFGWKILGAAYKQMGRTADALAPMQKAVALSPSDDMALSNLGATLQELGHLGESEAIYRQALQINPDNAKAHYNLSITLMKLGRLEEAEACCRRSLKIDPLYAEAHQNLGNILYELSRPAEAEDSFRRALQLKPDYAEAHSHLGITLQTLGRPDEALSHFQQLAILMPDNTAAQHHIAMLTGKNTERAPIQYVESLFDGYADNFDKHLVQNLKYDIPEKLVSLIMRNFSSPLKKWSVLDLGCGTGLTGAAIVPFTKQLVGVDLSSKMLEKAHARNIYQRLEQSDLLAMMRLEQNASYDLIIATDVFVYLGKLDEVICETRRLLRPGGIFAFSIEVMEPKKNDKDTPDIQPDYQLRKTGRYAQTAQYLSTLATAYHFKIKEEQNVPIRTDHGKPVNGQISVWESTLP